MVLGVHRRTLLRDLNTLPCDAMAAGHAGDLDLVADLDTAIAPIISVPKALANHTADRFLNVYALRRQGRIVNCWRGCWTRRERSTKQHSAEKAASYSGGDLTVLCVRGCWQQIPAKRDSNDSRSDFAQSGSPICQPNLSNARLLQTAQSRLTLR